MGLRQGHAQACLEAGHLARLHGLVGPELLPQGAQLPGSFSTRPLYCCQRPRLHTRQPAAQ